jgi:hypothetical protein
MQPAAGEELHDSMSHETVKYGRELHRTKNDCGGEGQPQSYPTQTDPKEERWE